MRYTKLTITRDAEQDDSNYTVQAFLAGDSDPLWKREFDDVSIIGCSTDLDGTLVLTGTMLQHVELHNKHNATVSGSEAHTLRIESAQPSE